jgi:hypothetical protein
MLQFSGFQRLPSPGFHLNARKILIGSHVTEIGVYYAGQKILAVIVCQFKIAIYVIST